MATRWFLNPRLQVGIALFTIYSPFRDVSAQSPSAPAGLLTSREAQNAGGVIFATNCAICHGVNGDGRGQRREGMNPPPANLTLPPWSEEAGAARHILAIRQRRARDSDAVMADAQ